MDEIYNQKIYNSTFFFNNFNNNRINIIESNTLGNIYRLKEKSFLGNFAKTKACTVLYELKLCLLEKKMTIIFFKLIFKWLSQIKNQRKNIRIIIIAYNENCILYERCLSSWRYF